MTRAVADDVLHGRRRVITGRPTTSDDFVSLANVVEATAESTPGMGGGSLDKETDRPLSMDVHETIVGLIDRIEDWPKWIEGASADEPVRAVELADRIVSMLEAFEGPSPWTSGGVGLLGSLRCAVWNCSHSVSTSPH